MHCDLAHPREVNYETAIASTETSEAMTATADGGENSGGRGDPDRVLHIADVRTACNEARLLGDHSVPDCTRFFIMMMLGRQQIAAEPLSERRMRLFD
jgi:hypothetical protein